MLPRARGKGRSTPPRTASRHPSSHRGRLGSEPVYVERGVESATLTRIVIEHVSPAVDGLFAAKTSVGDVVPIEADVFTDGHDLPAARVLISHDDADWGEAPMV